MEPQAGFITFRQNKASISQSACQAKLASCHCWELNVTRFSAPVWLYDFYISTANAAEMKARLKRMPSPSLFGGDLQELAFHAEMQTQNRLHFKVHAPDNTHRSHKSTNTSDKSPPDKLIP